MDRLIPVPLQEVQEFTKMAKEMNDHFQKVSKKGRLLKHEQALEWNVTVYQDLI